MLLPEKFTLGELQAVATVITRPRGSRLENRPLRRALQQYIVHYHEERNHQGRGNRILFPSRPEARRTMGAVRCRERLGGLLKYYERGSGIKVDGAAGDGLTTYIKDTGKLDWQKTSRA